MFRDPTPATAMPLAGATPDRPAAPRDGTAPADERRAWFAAQVEALLPDLLGAARRLAKNRADAEDLVADVVARAWMKLDTLVERAAFRGWVFRILTNCFLSCCREAAAHGTTESLDEPAGGEDDAPSLFERLHRPFLLWWGADPEHEFLNRLLREDLERAVDGLPESFRMAVLLSDVQGFSYQEIAELLAVPIGTVRSRLARGRSLLQQALWQHAVDAGIAPPAPQP